jgi:hypothetical protein
MSGEGNGDAGGREPDDGAETGRPEDPAGLLGEMAALRRRTRTARHAYWFPLVLFGLLTCLSAPFYVQWGNLGQEGAFAAQCHRVRAQA